MDLRDQGYRCAYCSKMYQEPMAFPILNQVVFPTGTESEIWIVNSHYDGCRGWD